MESVKFGKVTLVVDGHYDEGEPGDGNLQPPISPSYEINKVFLEFKDVTELITEIDSDFFSKIEEKILDKLLNK